LTTSVSVFATEAIKYHADSNGLQVPNSNDGRLGLEIRHRTSVLVMCHPEKFLCNRVFSVTALGLSPVYPNSWKAKWWPAVATSFSSVQSRRVRSCNDNEGLRSPKNRKKLDRWLSNASRRSTYRDGTSVQIAGTSSNVVGLANTRDCDQRVAYDSTAPIGPQESRLRDSGCLSTGQSNKEAQKHLCPIQLQVTAVLGIHQGCNR
jgi:hypothetical protein